jgi:large subunit ribosomal protein L13
VFEHLRMILGGPVVWAPAVDGAIVLSQRGGDFELVVGEDLSVGYLAHDAETVTLFIEESMAVRVNSPEAAVASRTSPTVFALARELAAGGLRPSGAIRWSCSARCAPLGPLPFALSGRRPYRGRSPSCVLGTKGLLRTPRTKGLRVRTYSPKASEIQRAGTSSTPRASSSAGWHRGGPHPARQAQADLRPHIDTGDHVIIVNADKIVLTSDKASKKMIYRHSGYPGGISSRSYGRLHEKKPAGGRAPSIRGMLPKTRLGRAQISKLKVYAGPTHPHAAQQPQPLALAAGSRAAAERRTTNDVQATRPRPPAAASGPSPASGSVPDRRHHRQQARGRRLLPVGDRTG